MKEFNRKNQALTNFVFICARFLLAAVFLFYLTRASAQTAPVLNMVSLGTNGFSITVTNGSPTSTYTLLQTHVLGNTVAYPWRYVTNGLAGQTNFTVPVPGPIATEFYQVVATNYTIGSFGMFIDSPVNGANLTQ